MRLCRLCLVLIVAASCARDHSVERAPPGMEEVPEAPPHPKAAEPPSHAPSPVHLRDSVTPPASSIPANVEIFPGVRIDRAARTVAFDGTVPIDCHNERIPVVYLEVVVCTPDTKEHEALVLTRVKPSHVHAALLALGLEPGRVGVWNWDGPRLTAEAPTGPRLNITLSYALKGAVIEATPEEWILNIRNQRTLAAEAGSNGWVFSGSAVVTRGGQEWYHADREGCLIGLTCFGHETISWTEMFSPDSGIHEPQWIADSRTVPPYGTAVTVTIQAPR